MVTQEACARIYLIFFVPWPHPSDLIESLSGAVFHIFRGANHSCFLEPCLSSSGVTRQFIVISKMTDCLNGNRLIIDLSSRSEEGLAYEKDRGITNGNQHQHWGKGSASDYVVAKFFKQRVFLFEKTA